MTRSDVDKLLSEFSIPSRKVFAYKQEFIPDHYVTIEKKFRSDKQGALIKNDEGTDFIIDYSIIKDQSTYVIPNFDNDLFIKLLMKEELTLPHESKWYMDITSFRTGGCDMGCWATGNPNLHSFGCRKHFK